MTPWGTSPQPLGCGAFPWQCPNRTAFIGWQADGFLDSGKKNPTSGGVRDFLLIAVREQREKKTFFLLLTKKGALSAPCTIPHYLQCLSFCVIVLLKHLKFTWSRSF
jgi:hypothetical protein